MVEARPGPTGRPDRGDSGVDRAARERLGRGGGRGQGNPRGPERHAGLPRQPRGDRGHDRSGRVPAHRGHPDEEAGEIPRAFVVLQDGTTATANEIMSYVAERVAPHKKVRLVDFVDVIPKSASGKILRRDLRGRSVTTSAAG
ncbi:hypothetical protein [Streptomyces sp. NPDC050548]|uniref:AMP-binding enzyme n=1 Tax=Streptomyces sp. NPDC050548 TaxID=3365629 RepID=UPI003796CBD7